MQKHHLALTSRLLQSVMAVFRGAFESLFPSSWFGSIESNTGAVCLVQCEQVPEELPTSPSSPTPSNSPTSDRSHFFDLLSTDLQIHVLFVWLNDDGMVRDLLGALSALDIACAPSYQTSWRDLLSRIPPIWEVRPRHMEAERQRDTYHELPALALQQEGDSEVASALRGPP